MEKDAFVAKNADFSSSKCIVADVTLSQENVSLKEEIATLSRRNVALEANSTKLSQDVVVLLKEKEVITCSCDHLVGEKDSLQSAHEDFLKAKAEIQSRYDQLVETSSLERKCLISEDKDSKIKIHALNSQNSSLRQEVKDFEKHTVSLEKELKHLKGQHEHDRQALVAHHEMELDKNTAFYAQRIRANEAAHLQALEKQKGDFQRECRQLVRDSSEKVVRYCDGHMRSFKVDVANAILTKSADELKKFVANVLERTNAPSDANDPVVDCLVPWRSVLSKVDIWYGCFGSNMWKPRFLCYIEGGQVVGMQKPCRGSMDRSPPKEIMWKSVPHRLFFGQSYTRTWGTGGVAFLHPEIDNQSRAYMCLYKITLEQFNDVLLQENRQSQPAVNPLFDLTALDLVERDNFMNLETPKDGWYSNVVYLGTEGDLPILTMTCPFSHIELFKSGKLPLNAPSKDYMNTLVKGLVDGEQLSEEEAVAYINENASKPF